MMRIDHIAESEVAVSKLKLLRNMAIFISNTKIRRILDLETSRFGFTLSLTLTLENNPYLDYEALTFDGKPGIPAFHFVLEIRGRGLKSFRGFLSGQTLVLKNLPEKFDILDNCHNTEWMYVVIEGSMPSPCYVHPDSDVLRYTFINVHTFYGKKVLDPDLVCQPHPSQKETVILDSEVVLPEGCFKRGKGVPQVLQVDLWNLQKNFMPELSSSENINGFDVRSYGPYGDDIDKLWKSSSALDCKYFCFKTPKEMVYCDKDRMNQSTFLCAFCLRNKFGKEGDQSMSRVCNYKGPLTLKEKLQSANSDMKEVEPATPGKNDTDAPAMSPSSEVESGITMIYFFNDTTKTANSLELMTEH